MRRKVGGGWGSLTGGKGSRRKRSRRKMQEEDEGRGYRLIHSKRDMRKRRLTLVC